MALVIIIDALTVAFLVGIALAKGFERALPFAAFSLVFFPSEVSKIEIPGLFDLTTQRLVIVVLLLLYIVVGRRGEAGDRVRKLPLKHLILLQICWMLIAVGNSVVFGTSFKAILSQIFDFYILYYIFAKGVSKVETVRNVLLGFFVAAAVCSVFGVIEAYLQWTVLSLFPMQAGRFGADLNRISVDLSRGLRVRSTFGHPILFGTTLAMAIPVGLYFLTVVKSGVKKFFLWCSIFLIFISVYKTGSRGPWMAVSISLALLLWFGRSGFRKNIAVIALLACAVLIIRPGVWETVESDYFSTLNPQSLEGESYEWRYALYHLAFRELGRNLGRAMWGYGPESFFYLGLKAEFGGKIVKFESCDSSFAALMIQTGYVGCLITTILLLIPGVLAFRIFRTIRKPANYLGLVLFVDMCVFYFMMTNSPVLAWGQQSYMLWILIALTMICRHVEGDSRVVVEHAGPESRLLEATPL